MYCWRDWVFAFNLQGHSRSRTNLLMPVLQYAALAKEKLVCIDTLWAKISQIIREQPRHGIRPSRDVTVAWFFHLRGSYENLFSLLSLGKKKTGNRMLNRTMISEGAFCFNLCRGSSNMISQQWKVYQFINTFLICCSLVERQWRVKRCDCSKFSLAV